MIRARNRKVTHKLRGVLRVMSSTIQSTVPFMDLQHVNARVTELVLADVADTIADGAFVEGPAIARFEQMFADFCGVREAVAVASGLDALRLALIALGVGAGDEVVVPAETFIATFEAVSQAGATPVVVDVSEGDYTIDPDQVEARIGPGTRAVLPVHMYGQMADMRRMRAVAERHGVHLVEDACQAHGAVRDGLRAGGAGDAAGFSFYPSKNLGAMGDAGAVTTADGQVAEAVRSLRSHGQSVKGVSVYQGYTARMDTLQAAVLGRKLPLLDGWNDDRRATAGYYGAALEGVGDLRPLPVPQGSEPVWYLYPLRTATAERMQVFLSERGIGTGRHYPQPPHLSAAYASLGHGRGSFPVAEALSDQLISLPMFPGITEAQLARVVDGVKEYFRDGV
jgi:dTDP-4-amino-4,6-dideoxygalactose transaminase